MLCFAMPPSTSAAFRSLPLASQSHRSPLSLPVCIRTDKIVIVSYFVLILVWLRSVLSQFGHGQSNPTFLMEVVGGGGSVKRYVVRKKPPGKLLQSAHAVEREYQVESVNHVWLLGKCR